MLKMALFTQIAKLIERCLFGNWPCNEFDFLKFFDRIFFSNCFSIPFIVFFANLYCVDINGLYDVLFGPF